MEAITVSCLLKLPILCWERNNLNLTPNTITRKHTHTHAQTHMHTSQVSSFLTLDIMTRIIAQAAKRVALFSIFQTQQNMTWVTQIYTHMGWSLHTAWWEGGTQGAPRPPAVRHGTPKAKSIETACHWLHRRLILVYIYSNCKCTVLACLC